MRLYASGHASGQPTHLDLPEGRFVLIRDGTPSNSSNGEPCLYGRVDSFGYVDRTQYFIASWYWTPEGAPVRPALTCNPWIQDMAICGQSPIVIPPEPITWPPACS